MIRWGPEASKTWNFSGPEGIKAWYCWRVDSKQRFWERYERSCSFKKRRGCSGDEGVREDFEDRLLLTAVESKIMKNGDKLELVKRRCDQNHWIEVKRGKLYGYGYLI